MASPSPSGTLCVPLAEASFKSPHKAWHSPTPLGDMIFLQPNFELTRQSGEGGYFLDIDMKTPGTTRTLLICSV